MESPSSEILGRIAAFDGFVAWLAVRPGGWHAFRAKVCYTWYMYSVTNDAQPPLHVAALLGEGSSEPTCIPVANQSQSQTHSQVRMILLRTSHGAAISKPPPPTQPRDKVSWICGERVTSRYPRDVKDA